MLDTTKDKDLGSSSSGAEDDLIPGDDKTIQLSQDELKAMEAVKIKQELIETPKPLVEDQKIENKPVHLTKTEVLDDNEHNSDTDNLKDVLTLPSELLDNDLVNTLIKCDDEELTKTSLNEPTLTAETSSTQGTFL